MSYRTGSAASQLGNEAVVPASDDVAIAKFLPLRIGPGDYLELSHLIGRGNYLLPYENVKPLGHGGCASVQAVKDTYTGKLYARKMVGNVTKRNLEKIKENLYNEVQIMRKLGKNYHFVKLHMTIIFN